MGRVEGKVAMITGGRRGLGKASAILLAKEGARIVITDRKSEGADAVLGEIHRNGGEAIFLEQDVSVESDWQNVMDIVSVGKYPDGRPHPSGQPPITSKLTAIKTPHGCREDHMDR